MAKARRRRKSQPSAEVNKQVSEVEKGWRKEGIRVPPLHRNHRKKK